MNILYSMCHTVASPVISRCCGSLLFPAVVPFMGTDGIDPKVSFHTTGPIISRTHTAGSINLFFSFLLADTFLSNPGLDWKFNIL